MYYQLSIFNHRLPRKRKPQIQKHMEKLTFEELEFLIEIIDVYIYEDHVRDTYEVRNLKSKIQNQILNT